MAYENLLTSSASVPASTTTLPNAVPITDSTGTLNSFIARQSSVAVPNAIPIADGFGSLYGWGVSKNNLTATTDPSLTSDLSLGYRPGSLWVNTTNGTGNYWVCLSGTVGNAIWVPASQQNPSAVINGRLQTYNSQVNHFYGGYNDYFIAQVIAASAMTMQRNWLNAGTVITKMEVCLNSSVVSNLNLGIYNEVNMNPSALMAQTGSQSLPSSSSFFASASLLASWTVPTSGYYWFAIVCDSATPSFFASASVILPIISRLVRGQNITGVAMPATATPLVTASQNLYYIAAVE